MSSNEEMVKVRYAASSPDVAITKKLFGYKDWEVKVGVKTYEHKSIPAALEGIPARRIARATIIVPQEYLPQTKRAIEKSGGVVTSAEPMMMDPEGSERTAMIMFDNFANAVVRAVRRASKSKTKEDYVKLFDKTIVMTRKFESFVNEIDEYNSLKSESQLLRTLTGLKSLADQDFEAAKIQAAFFAVDLAKLKAQIRK